MMRPVPATLETTSASWPVASWAPDGIVIAPGRQTLAIDTTFVSTTFPQKYKTFIDTLRGDYPNAVFATTTSPILGDYTDLGPALDNTLAPYDPDAASGPRVARCDFSRLSSGGGGCTGHPMAAQQATMATEIEQCVKTLAGW